MPHQRAISVAIAESEPIFAIGMQTLLARQAGLTVVGIVENGQEAVELVARTEPDVLLVDHRPPKLNAVEIAARLKQAGSSTRVIILAVKVPEARIQSALLQGAWGVVSRANAGDVLPSCIEKVMTGERWIGIESVHAFVGGLRALTPRELEVVRQVALGASNKEIASRLEMGEQTVKNSLRRIFKKAGVSNRVELAVLAVEQHKNRP